MHKVEQKGGFGLENVNQNRHLVGRDWSMQACPPSEWEPMAADAVFGNPPCSGFSPLSPKEFRGSGSPINSCMHALVEYAAKIDPYVVVFESVAQAFSGGRDLMQFLRDKMEELTGQSWDLYHVKHNAASVGGCAIRRRYFWVCSRIPFGVEPYDLRRLPVLDDAIADLRGLGMSWENQVPRRPASWWLQEQGMRDTLVDGHRCDWTPYARRAVSLIEGGEEWGYREIIANVARRYYQKHGELPSIWDGSAKRVIESDFNLGYNQITRWHPHRMARVITGGALSLVMHPYEHRPITHREAARIMGFPDNWLIRPLRKVGGLRMTWGKQIPVQTGRWISHWVKASIEGTPGSDTGEPIGERERLIDRTNDYRKFTSES